MMGDKKMKLRKSVKTNPVVWLIPALFLLTGCMREPANPQKNLLLPVKGPILTIQQEVLPVLAVDGERTTFKWPGIDYVLIHSENKMYAVDQQSETQAQLILNRQQIRMSSPNGWTDYMRNASLEITDRQSLKHGFLMSASDPDERRFLLHLQGMNDADPVVINQSDQTDQDYLISEDRSIIVFFDDTDQVITVYNTESKQTTQLTALTADQFCLAWTSQIDVSPKGTYVIHKNEGCNEKASQFTTYSTTSGRSIHAPLPGADPQWDSEEKHIAFLLHQLEQGIDPGIRDRPLVQAAVYTLENSELQFLNRVPETFHITVPPIFSSDGRYILYGAENETERNLIIYHRLQHVQQIVALTLSETMTLTRERIYFDYPVLLFPDLKLHTLSLIIHDLENEIVESVADIDYWVQDDLPNKPINRYYTGSAGDAPRIFYLKKGGLVQYQNGNHQVRMMIDDESTVLNMSSVSNMLILTIQTREGDKELHFINL
jgi:hypothetical protein